MTVDDSKKETVMHQKKFFTFVFHTHNTLKFLVSFLKLEKFYR